MKHDERGARIADDSPSVYTLEAGRCIVRDGKPFCTIHGVTPYQPTEVDAYARAVAIAAPRMAIVLEKFAERLDRWLLSGIQAGPKGKDSDIYELYEFARNALKDWRDNA